MGHWKLCKRKEFGGLLWLRSTREHAAHSSKGSSPATLPKFKPFPSIELLYIEQIKFLELLNSFPSRLFDYSLNSLLNAIEVLAVNLNK
jgi:hypothetical protein